MVAGPGSDTDACVELRAGHYDTKYTSSMTGKAIAETQKIHLTSSVVPEQQVTHFSLILLFKEIHFSFDYVVSGKSEIISVVF